MMKRRLLIAKRFLKPDGVLIVAIDDNELNTVSLLLREMFIERDLEKVIVVHHPQGNNGINVWATHEYALFAVPKGRKTLFGYKHEMKEEFWSLRRSGTGAGNWRTGRPKMFFAIHVDEKRRKVVGVGKELGREEKYPTGHTKEGYRMVYPIDEKGGERIWRYGRETMIEKIDRGEIVLKGRNGTSLAVAAPPRSHAPIFSVWDAPQYNAGTAGANLLTSIMGSRNAFPFPKSLYTVQDCIGAVCRDRPHALILDFFAGSGTTLHATCLLNAEDGGNRRCILVTNNEVAEKTANELDEEGILPGDPRFEKYGICESVTWPRCKFVVNGKRDDGTVLSGEYVNGMQMSEGFEENLQYFRLGYLDPNDVAYREKLSDILPMLWLMAKAKGDFESMKRKEAWFTPQHSPYAVLLEESAFAAFRKALKERPDITHVFLVTDAEEAYRDMCGELPKGIKAKMLYKSYLDNFRINIPLIQ
jgi:adenine-specific DNA-methyltransferase